MIKPAGFPDFFVVGAPRCGTTSLCRYLSRHPQICFSRPKEPHYFIQLDEVPSFATLKQDYIDQFFAHRTAAHRFTGEGSVSYLLLPESIEKILSINSDAKFIAIVRNPLEMLPSYHQRMLFLLQEDESDFDKAWALQSARARGEQIPDTCLNQMLLMYSVGAKLGAQIKRLFAIAGRDRCQVIVFDDFCAYVQHSYRAVLEFLGIEFDGQTEFERRYESQMYRFRRLQKLMFLPAIRGGNTLDSIQRRKRKYLEDGSKKKDLIKRIADINKVAQRPPKLSVAMTATIKEQMREDNQLLSELLQRDLSFWLEPDKSIVS